jgi:hypothetical protein
MDWYPWSNSMTSKISRFDLIGFFFLWGHLKNVVYTDPPINLQDLKNKIRLACNNLREEQINAATLTEFIKLWNYVWNI